MNTLFYIFSTLFFVFAIEKSISANDESNIINEGVRVTEDISIIKFDEFRPMLEKDNDTIYVLNFWATWCGPCVKEIPYFEQLGNKYSDQNLKIIMVSLDMKSQIDSNVIPFIEKHNMSNEVIVLDDPDFNSWIPIVDEDWQGGIPATLIYGNGFREFYPSELTFNELEEIIKPLLKN